MHELTVTVMVGSNCVLCSVFCVLRPDSQAVRQSDVDSLAISSQNFFAAKSEMSAPKYQQKSLAQKGQMLVCN